MTFYDKMQILCYFYFFYGRNSQNTGKYSRNSKNTGKYRIKSEVLNYKKYRKYRRSGRSGGAFLFDCLKGPLKAIPKYVR